MARRAGFSAGPRQPNDELIARNPAGIELETRHAGTHAAAGVLL